MTLEGITLSVNNWLKRQQVMVLDEWVNACVEWLKSEYKEALNNPTELQQLVYEQWLDSDLADVGTPCLPNGIAQQQKGVLKGVYILQINSLRDVSTPAYSQLVKLRGQENENAQVTATQQTQSRFEPKSSRMLMLQLTDGHQSIEAMEFAPIPGLSVNTSPGTKIQVCGNIQCRLGVLVLSPENVKVLGGEVDALVASNNQDAVLAQALGQASIPLDQQTAQPTQQDQSQPNQLPQQQQVSQQHQQQASHQQQADRRVIDLTDDQPVNNVSSGGQNNKQLVQKTRQQEPNIRLVQDDPFMDDFDDDDDFDEVMLQGLEEIELQQGQPRQNQQTAQVTVQQEQQRNNPSAQFSNTTYNSPPSTASDQASASHMNKSQQSKQNHQSSSNFHSNKGNMSNSNSMQRPNMAVAARISKQDPSETNSGFLRHSNGSRTSPTFSGQSGSTRTGNLGATGYQGRTFLDASAQENRNTDQKSSEFSRQSGSTITGNSGTDNQQGRTFLGAPAQENRNRDQKSSDFSRQSGSTITGNSGTANQQGRTFLGAPAQQNRNSSNLIKQEPSSFTSRPSGCTSGQSRQGFVKFDPSNQPGKTTIGSTSVFEPFNSTVKSEPGPSSNNQDRFHPETKPNPTRLSRQFVPASSVVKQEPSENRLNQFQSVHAAQAVQTKPVEFGRTAQRSSREGSTSGMSTGSSADEDEIMMAKRRRFFSGQNSDSSGSLPYSTLSLASRKLETKENCVMQIKGFIMTLVSSLTCKKGWNVIAKINDGTASMDVDLGNEVLTKLIGFSVLELMQMKKAASRASSDRQAEIKKQMQQGLEKCQQALIDMSCIMTLEIRPEYEHPRVLTFREVNNSDCMALIQQL